MGKGAVVAILVVMLVLVGIGGYLWYTGNQYFYEGEHKALAIWNDIATLLHLHHKKGYLFSKRWYECSGGGFAIIKINGKTLLSSYSYGHSWYWKNGKTINYCSVSLHFLNGSVSIKDVKIPHVGEVDYGNRMVGIQVNYTVFKTELLVRKFPNKGVLLNSLNGFWISDGGKSLTDWWNNNMTEVKASKIWWYINGLWSRMTNGTNTTKNKYYSYIFPSTNWEMPPKPLPNQTVKIYSINLWFGARLDVLAYQNPTKPHKLVVIMYATVDNMTKWYEGLARLAVFNGMISPHYLGGYTDNIFGTSLEAGSFDDLVAIIGSKKDLGATMALWEVRPPIPPYGWNTWFVDNTTLLRPEVYWLMDEPLLKFYPATSSNLYWFIVGMPVFQLTANMMINGKLYDYYILWVKEVIHAMLPEWRFNFENGGVTPATLRIWGGVCDGFSFASDMIASLSAGLPTARIGGFVPLKQSGGETVVSGHAISLIVIPSTIRSSVNVLVPLGISVTGKGGEAKGMILYDIAHLVENNELNFFLKTEDEITIASPYEFTIGVSDGQMMELAGISSYPKIVGKPFAFNLNYLSSVKNFNFFEDSSNPPTIMEITSGTTFKFIIYGKVPQLKNYTVNYASPSALITGPNGGVGAYIWKIDVGITWGGVVKVKPNMTPSWFFHFDVVPLGISQASPLQATGSKEYFIPSISFMYDLYLMAIKYDYGPVNLSTLPPPTMPHNLPPPLPLQHYYPSLSKCLIQIDNKTVASWSIPSS